MKRLILFLAGWGTLLLSSAGGANCERTTTGFIPLNDPFFFSFQRAGGGLYPGGINKRPPAHDSLGSQLAAQVIPRNAAGISDEQNGKIVFLSIGMSNATQEFSLFKTLADQDGDKNPKVVIVDGAQGGWSADRIVADPATYWGVVQQRLARANATSAQVQAAWAKFADASPTLPFPQDARKLQSEIGTIVQSLPVLFPNLKLLYFSSRIYGGYAATNLNPEPYAYQSAFAVKWIIEDQINGDPDLSVAAGRSPWLAWGPYLWADGLTMRSDGLVWRCSDLAEDGTHPSASGRQKVAWMLLDYLKSDRTAHQWFVRQPTQPPPPPFIASIVNSAGYGAQVALESIASLFGTHLAAEELLASTLPLPTTLGGTQVEIGGIPALLRYVSPTQINFVLPKGSEDLTVRVIHQKIESNSLQPMIVRYAPGLFTLDGSANGSAAAQHGDFSLITPQSPARRGETIALYATGFGVRNPLSLAPEILPVVRIGAVSAPVTYVGVSPGSPGVNQVNVTVPPNAPTGLDVAVVIQFGSSISNQATLAVATSP